MPPQVAPQQVAPQQAAWPQQPLPGYAPAGYVVPQPRRVAVPVPAGPLEYHRLSFKREHPQWWASLLTAVLMGGLILAATVVGMVFAIIPMMRSGLDAFLNSGDALADLVMLDPDNPWMFVLLMASVIIMLPAAIGASRIVQGRGVGFLTSVTGKMRWGWLGTTLLIATVFYVILNAISLILEPASGADISAALRHPNFLLIILLVLVLVPIQCAAEEYVFRGVFMQAIGRWLKNPWWAILLPAPLFMAAHMYNIWGQLSVGFMAVIAGYLTWRTGGLEAAIALHVVNNVSIFLLEACGIVDSTGEESGVMSLVAIMILELGYAAVVVWFAKRKNIQRTSAAII